MAVSIRAAIGDARSKVSELHRLDKERWVYFVWSDTQRAWLPAFRAERYEEAHRKMLASISSLAAFSVLGNETDDPDLALQIISSAFSRSRTGSVHRRVAEILESLDDLPRQPPRRAR